MQSFLGTTTDRQQLRQRFWALRRTQKTDARQRALESAFKQSLLKGVERLCAHMVQLREADSHALVHIDIEVHQGKRSLS